MSFNTQNQDSFYTKAMNNKLSIVFYLLNGTSIKGMIKDFDSHTITIMLYGKKEGAESEYELVSEEIIFKHAIVNMITTAHSKSKREFEKKIKEEKKASGEFSNPYKKSAPKVEYRSLNRPTYNPNK